MDALKVKEVLKMTHLNFTLLSRMNQEYEMPDLEETPEYICSGHFGTRRVEWCDECIPDEGNLECPYYRAVKLMHYSQKETINTLI